MPGSELCLGGICFLEPGSEAHKYLVRASRVRRGAGRTGQGGVRVVLTKGAPQCAHLQQTSCGSAPVGLSANAISQQCWSLKATPEQSLSWVPDQEATRVGRREPWPFAEPTLEDASLHHTFAISPSVVPSHAQFPGDAGGPGTSGASLISRCGTASPRAVHVVTAPTRGTNRTASRSLPHSHSLQRMPLLSPVPVATGISVSLVTPLVLFIQNHQRSEIVLNAHVLTTLRSRLGAAVE